MISHIPIWAGKANKWPKPPLYKNHINNSKLFIEPPTAVYLNHIDSNELFAEPETAVYLNHIDSNELFKALSTYNFEIDKDILT